MEAKTNNTPTAVSSPNYLEKIFSERIVYYPRAVIIGAGGDFTADSMSLYRRVREVLGELCLRRDGGFGMTTGIPFSKGWKEKGHTTGMVLPVTNIDKALELLRNEGFMAEIESCFDDSPAVLKEYFFKQKGKPKAPRLLIHGSTTSKPISSIIDSIQATGQNPDVSVLVTGGVIEISKVITNQIFDLVMFDRPMTGGQIAKTLNELGYRSMSPFELMGMILDAPATIHKELESGFYLSFHTKIVLDDSQRFFGIHYDRINKSTIYLFPADTKFTFPRSKVGKGYDLNLVPVIKMA